MPWPKHETRELGSFFSQVKDLSQYSSEAMVIGRRRQYVLRISAMSSQARTVHHVTLSGLRNDNGALRYLITLAAER